MSHPPLKDAAFLFLLFSFFGGGGSAPSGAWRETRQLRADSRWGCGGTSVVPDTTRLCALFLPRALVCVCVCVVQKKQNKQKQPTEADVAGEVRFGAEEQTQTVVDSLCAEGRRLFTHILLHFQKSSLPSLFSDLPPLHPFPLLLWNITPLLPNPHL